MKQWNDVSQNKKLRDIFIIGNEIWKKNIFADSMVSFILLFQFQKLELRRRKIHFSYKMKIKWYVSFWCLLKQKKIHTMEVGMVGNGDLASIDANGNGESLGTHEAWVENGIFSKSFIEHLKQNIETMGWMD